MHPSLPWGGLTPPLQGAAMSLAYITMVGQPWMAHKKAACDHCGAHKERRELYYVERDSCIVSQICRSCLDEDPHPNQGDTDHG
jgi:hypothetical protein